MNVTQIKDLDIYTVNFPSGTYLIDDEIKNILNKN